VELFAIEDKPIENVTAKGKKFDTPMIPNKASPDQAQQIKTRTGMRTCIK
jgi:hypothetical protein